MKTQFVQISPFGEEFARMQTFARSFDHCIEPANNAKLLAFKRDDVIFGYADVIYLPIAFPAFHPALTTPRRVVEVIDGWKSHCQFANGGDGLIGVPLDQDRVTFPKEMIENAGFSRMKREIYSLNQQD